MRLFSYLLHLSLTYWWGLNKRGGSVCSLSWLLVVVFLNFGTILGNASNYMVTYTNFDMFTYIYIRIAFSVISAWDQYQMRLECCSNQLYLLHPKRKIKRKTSIVQFKFPKGLLHFKWLIILSWLYKTLNQKILIKLRSSKCFIANNTNPI